MHLLWIHNSRRRQIKQNWSHWRQKREIVVLFQDEHLVWIRIGTEGFQKSFFTSFFLTQNLYENWDWRQFSLHLVSIFGSLESADLHSGDEGEGNAGNGGSAVLLAIIVDHRKPSCGRSFRSRSPTSSQSLLCRSCWSLMSELMTLWGLFHLQPHRCSQLCSWRAVVIFIWFPI